MAAFSLKRTIGRGVALAIPLAVVGYVLMKFIDIFEKIAEPLAKKFGVDKILGEITLTIFALLIILVLIFILGLLMQIAVVASVRKELEDTILKVVPSMNQLKLMAAEKLDLENATSNWKPVLVYREEAYLPAYITEENEQWITFVLAKISASEQGDILIAKKENCSYIEINMKQMHHFTKQYGRGFLSVLK